MNEITVGEFLRRFENPFKTVTVTEESSILEVLETMVAQKEERIVYVVDTHKRLRGVITVGRLARHFFNEEISPQRGFTPSSSILQYLTAEHAKDIMDRDVVYCTEEDVLENVLKKMFGKRVKKTIPVVDARMRIVDALNIVTIMDARLNESSVPE